MTLLLTLNIAQNVGRTHSGTFRHRVYDNAELINSEQLTIFSDHRLLLDSRYFTNSQSYFDRFELGIFVKLGNWASYLGAFS